MTFFPYIDDTFSKMGQKIYLIYKRPVKFRVLQIFFEKQIWSVFVSIVINAEFTFYLE